MSYFLLKEYIKNIFESRLPPSTNGIASGRNGFSKNQQTPGFAGGDGRVLYKDQRIQSPDDGLYYQYMQIDGPSYDQNTGDMTACCKIDQKFRHLFPKNMHEYTLVCKGNESELNNKIDQYYLKIKTTIDQNINDNNIYIENNDTDDMSSW